LNTILICRPKYTPTAFLYSKTHTYLHTHPERLHRTLSHPPAPDRRRPRQRQIGAEPFQLRRLKP
jgi:hypothetical protein